MRLFLAVFPPPEAQVAADRATQVLRASGGRPNDVSWVRRDNLHYTLRFLGEQDDEGFRRAADAAREAAGRHAPFGAAIGGFGAFPSAKRARVLWIGMLAGAEPMRLLAAALEEALVARGFGADDHAFEPHLTVARVRTSADWTRALVSAPSFEARFRVEAISLVRSTLASGGPKYEVIEREALGARP